LQQRAAADSHINGCEGKRIPDLTRQSGFNGNAKPLISLIGSPVINGNATPRSRLAARFVADTGRQEIAAAEAAVAQARLGRGDLEAAIARLGRARSVLADALAVLD
jgi:hypothetical protein